MVSGPAQDPALLEPASAPEPLRRLADPVLVTGETLPEDFLGIEIRRLRVYAHREGGLAPIRFQVDERTDEGDWVFPHGKRHNRYRSTGRLDPQDVILFMARDAGPEAAEPVELPGEPAQVLPVELVDPVDGGRGWVYLARYPEGASVPPLCPLPDYVQYDAQSETLSSAFMRGGFIVTEEGFHTAFHEHLSIPPEAGGSGENLLDRLKFRVAVRFFHLLPASLHEERLGSDRIAYIQGPVRNLRRFQQFVKMPLGLRGVKTYADVETYEAFTSTPITLHVPWGVQWVVSSARLRYGTDYAPGMIGSFFRSSEQTDALIVDGRMSEAEKRLSTAQDRWRVFYGAHGALLTRTFFPPELMESVHVRQGFLDDMEAALAPERHPGSIGFAYTEVHVHTPQPGTHRMFLEFYFPAHYRPGDEQHYLELRDHPLRIRILDRETENPGHLVENVGRDF